MRRLLRNLALYAFHVGFARPVLHWIVGIRYRRRSLLPKGPCLVVSNHNSHLDAAILMGLFPLRRLPHVHPVAAADYFGSTWLKRTMALFFMNGIAIERNPPKGSDPLAPIVDALRSGESLVFFPEGSRGEAGVVAPFRTGIGRLARSLPGLLVVPVYLSGPERIWPRGEVVPVPLSIDAVVGRPRSYPPEEDPREIADQVRSDVLALAPPPPPVPGPPPAPPLRVAICGPKSMRRPVFREVVERLAPGDTVLGISDPMIEGDQEGVREITEPIPFARGGAWLKALPRIFRTGGRYKGQHFVDMVERAQISEALGQGSDRRFVVSDGSALVDLMAWAEADFYRGQFSKSEVNHLLRYLAGEKKIPLVNWWRFIRRAPEVWLVNVFDLARPPIPDLLVLAHQSPEQMMQEIRSRGEALEPWENEAFLTRLDQAYRDVGQVLQRRRRVRLLELDMSAMSQAEAAELIVELAHEGRAEPAAEVPPRA